MTQDDASSSNANNHSSQDGMRQRRTDVVARLTAALESEETSVRLKVAMHVGSNPLPELIEVLIDRCAVESDFFVRDMLTWALPQHARTQQDRTAVVDALLGQLTAPSAQARSQALHTLSKIGDRRAWSSIGTELLTDADDQVARAAWRAAVGMVPDSERAWLTQVLGTQLGRGSREVWLSLSRALMALGEASTPVLDAALESSDDVVRMHAVATVALIEDPESGFELAVQAAERTHTLRGAPLIGADLC